MKEHLVSLSEYNTWANKKIHQFIIDAGEDKCLIVQKSSFPTIHDTLIHIWDAQSIWLDRWHDIVFTTWPGKTFKGSTAEAALALVENSMVWADLVHSIDNEKFESVIHYRNIKGDEFASSCTQIIQHVMNHSTYHRGQLVTMLRGAGLTALASTDFISFCREVADR
jgi:uncharacterized damage-inducible protein DinB